MLIIVFGFWILVVFGFLLLLGGFVFKEDEEFVEFLCFFKFVCEFGIIVKFVFVGLIECNFILGEFF